MAKGDAPSGGASSGGGKANDAGDSAGSRSPLIDLNADTVVPGGDAAEPVAEPFAARSTVDALAAFAAEGTQLRDLSGEEPIPELHHGTERYHILGVLGEGGMAKVFLAFDHDLRRRVALKVVRLGPEDAVQRFLDEAQVMAQLDHPNVVPVFDVGLTDRNTPYYTMRVVRGETLHAVIGALRAGDAAFERRYSLARRMQIFEQIAQAVAYAHARGVVHRDLKPLNVMLGDHGEVQVMDWGLAKVFRRGGVELGEGREPSALGRALGTPGYMAPEQATGMGVDPRTDIWALGVLLYELLLLRRPWEGEPQDVLKSILSDSPPRAREVAPDRNVPIELERAALRALAKPREDRYPSVEQMIADVQAWIESEADRSARRHQAEAKARAGRVLLEEYRLLRTQLEEAEAAVATVARRARPWQPVAEKGELFAARDRVEAVRERLVRAAATAVATLEQALGFDESNAEARELLADYYWSRFLAAEEIGDEVDQAFFADRVANYDDGEYARRLKGDGVLELATTPAGAELRLERLVDDRCRLEPVHHSLLGESPVGPLSLAMGSYRVVCRHDRLRDVIYPVHIDRNREWHSALGLGAAEGLGEEMVFVPAGPFVLGGDPEQRSWALPRQRAELPDFAIAEQPVTMAEYLEYLAAVTDEQCLEVARRRAPRATPEGSTLLLETAGHLSLPRTDREGNRWDPRWPVIGVSFQDALAYCRWRGGRDGCDYRLPSEREWEKAARGVDGRRYPWGERFDASLANMRLSHEGRPRVVPVDEFPSDRSIYGVRGLGGNVRDWTSTEWTVEGSDGAGGRIVRGGTWNYSELVCRVTNRFSIVSEAVHLNLGFRLALSL